MQSFMNPQRQSRRLSLFVAAGLLTGVLAPDLPRHLINPTATISQTIHHDQPMPPDAFAGAASKATAASGAEVMARLPLSFVAASGPAEAPGQYQARGSGYAISLTATETELRLQPVRRDQGDGHSSGASGANGAASPGASVRMKLGGGNPAARITGIDELPGQVNRFIGNDPQHWRTGARTYARVRVDNVWPGVDVIYYGQQRQLEYDFVVAPGTDPQVIALDFTGADKIETDAQGNLVLHAADAELRQHKPVIWQEVNGEQQHISGHYVQTGDHQFGFAVDSYDATRPLVIDPVVSYATYLGGTGEELGIAVAADAAGNTYVTGVTSSGDFPGAATGTFKPPLDVFVTKLNATGTALVYTTYLGGTGSADVGSGIAVDAAGNAYITGTTNSADFPTRNPLQATLRGAADAFITKLSSTGALVYSTYYGGSGAEAGYGIAVDAGGNVYVTGGTSSTDLTPIHSVQSALNGQSDAFILKLNAAGTAPVYATYLGGSEPELGLAIAVDAASSAYVTGITSSSDFPTRNPVQPAFGGGSQDSFVTKLSPDGALVYSTYLGGSGTENTALSSLPIPGCGIAVDTAGNAYVASDTTSTDFPVANALYRGLSGNSDGYVTKLNASGTAFSFSTYLGDRFDDGCLGIAVDGAGRAWVTGGSTIELKALPPPEFAALLPLPGHENSGESRADSPATPEATKGHAFITQFNQTGSALLYNTSLSGNGNDYGTGIAVDAAGNAHVIGRTFSSNFLSSFSFLTPVQGSLRGPSDMFIARVRNDAPVVTTVASVSAASYNGSVLAPESIVAAFGSNLSAGTGIATTLPLPTVLAGTTVKVRDSQGQERAAPLFFVSAGQINYLIPAGTAPGPATLTVVRSDGSTAATGTAQIATVAPSLFSANSSGRDVASALALRVRQGVQSYEPVAVWDAAQQRMVPVPIDLGPDGDQVFLILFGTGLRFHNNPATGSIGGTSVDVLYAGAQGGFAGLDQINVRLPRTLARRGTVDIALTLDNRAANPVTVNIR